MTNPVRKIAILGSRGYPSSYGGYETAVRHISKSWIEQGIEVIVYCRDHPPSYRSWVQDGVECRWTPGVDNKSLSTLSYGMSSHIDVTLRKVDAALILNVANGFFLPVLNRVGIPTALNTDGIEWERGKWGTTAKKIFLAGAKASARFADVLISDSQAIAQIWRRKFGVDSEYIPYGATIIPQHDSGRVIAAGMRPGSYALVVARLIPENNVDLTLRALESGSPFPLVVVGDANYNSPIEKRLKQLQASGRVLWLGHVDDQDFLNELWGNAGVYIHGHSVGGTNPALLQALGAGAPTIALDTPFNREVLRKSDQLFPRNVQVLGQMVRNVLSNESLRNQWSQIGREIVRDRYDWSDVSSRYLNALELANLRRGRSRHD